MWLVSRLICWLDSHSTCYLVIISDVWCLTAQNIALLPILAPMSQCLTTYYVCIYPASASACALSLSPSVSQHVFSQPFSEYHMLMDVTLFTGYLNICRNFEGTWLPPLYFSLVRSYKNSFTNYQPLTIKAYFPLWLRGNLIYSLHSRTYQKARDLYINSLETSNLWSFSLFT